MEKRIPRKEKKKLKKSLIGRILYLLKIESKKAPKIEDIFSVNMGDIGRFLEQFPKENENMVEYTWNLTSILKENAR